ncbi:MAG: hypothetical protein HYV95_11625 [Opitutae bacterium]|nr:hypothetical protein [Opitutae bacterium]
MTLPTKLLAPVAALAATLTLSAAGGPAPVDERAPAPVSVSSANYAASSREDILRAVAEKDQVNPSTLALARLARPQRYVFMPGETYEADIPYGEICRRLSETLAQKGFFNATDPQGRVIDPTNVDLILRVHSGERTWRNPTVREDRLTWHDGLVARPTGRTLSTLGGDVSWENRAGGNDDALGAAAANENARGFCFGSTPGTPAGGSPLSTGSDFSLSQAKNGGSEYTSTREFYLIVVDAFSYTELKEKGDRAKRLWTTFVAAPRQPDQKFSDVLNTMLRVATPYFGETTRGLQMFKDARANVQVGPTEVIESDVKLSSDRKD